jgi:hypothetical protein
MEHPMIKVTLDSNCVFVLNEKDQKKAASVQQFVRRLINLHKQRKIEIQISLMTAFENRLGERRGISLDKYKDSRRNLERELQQKIEIHGFNPFYLYRLAIMPEPELYPGPNLFPAGKDTIALFEKIRDIVHPEIDFDGMLEEAQKKDPEVVFAPEWKSAYIDILICLSHIISKADILVSKDKHIYGKAKELERCGAGMVLSCSAQDQKRFDEFLKNPSRKIKK